MGWISFRDIFLFAPFFLSSRQLPESVWALYFALNYSEDWDVSCGGISTVARRHFCEGKSVARIVRTCPPRADKETHVPLWEPEALDPPHLLHFCRWIERRVCFCMPGNTFLLLPNDSKVIDNPNPLIIIITTQNLTQNCQDASYASEIVLREKNESFDETPFRADVVTNCFSFGFCPSSFLNRSRFCD